MIAARIDGADRAARRIGRLERNAAYYTSVAINRTAEALQKNIIHNTLPKAFTLAGKQRKSRGAPWWRPGTKLGFNLRFARKDNLKATIRSGADWLPLHEKGGDKRPIDGRDIAVPTKEILPSKNDLINANKRPKKLLRNKRVFVKKIKGKLGIWRVTGRKRSRRIRMLYSLRPSVRIRPTFGLQKSSQEFYRRYGRKIFEREFRKGFTKFLIHDQHSTSLTDRFLAANSGRFLSGEVQ